MEKTLESYLYHFFGYKTFKTYQKQIIESILQGKDVLAMLATGTGKSLCYQLPAFIQEGLVVVVSPLLALMENQVQELKQKGLKRVAAYNSFLTYSEKQHILRRINNYDIIFISPESIQQEAVTKRLIEQNITLFAVDEAHCISQWGHEFRTDYLKLGLVREKIGNPPCLALTATAAPNVQADIKESLSLEEPSIFYDSVDRKNISLEVIKLNSEAGKNETIIRYLNQLPTPGLVYTASRSKAEKLSRMINNKTNSNAYAYHGGMSQEDRQLIQQQFLSGEIDTICCTNAFGMGINKPDIRFVIHYDFPKDIESYVQEIGRAGRDGQESSAVLLTGEGDGYFPRQMIDIEFPDKQQIITGIDRMEKDEKNYVLEKRLIDSCGFDEQHARFLVYYWKEWQAMKQTEISAVDYIFSVVNKRRRWKLQKLLQIEEWIYNEKDCRRQNLLSCFGEMLTEHPNRCCDICGIEISLSKKDSSSRKKLNIYNWKTRLNMLLHQHE